MMMVLVHVRKPHAGYHQLWSVSAALLEPGDSIIIAHMLIASIVSPGSHALTTEKFQKRLKPRSILVTKSCGSTQTSISKPAQFAMTLTIDPRKASPDEQANKKVSLSWGNQLEMANHEHARHMG